MKYILIITMSFLFSCSREADVASRNLSRDADEFRIKRRIVFYNGITDSYLLEIIGFCSLGNFDSNKQVSITCKTDNGYKKHFLGLSDNVTFFSEQIQDSGVSGQYYKVIFRPASIFNEYEIK